MLKFTVGNILESDTECLVNTVNCEGYMGKGIAYQFKLKFPDNNREYVKACKSGLLKIGTLHYFQEKEKTIINFPTKDKWRQKSQVDYIKKGLQELVDLIQLLKIESISIPPLGCGNGGLKWHEIKPIIIEYLLPLSESLDIVIYEPSQYYNPTVVEAPRLSLAHLILMNFKLSLDRFTKLRLQKTAYFMNLCLRKEYFKFTKHKYGPYAHSIEILSKDIKQFQDFYCLDTEQALNLAKTTLISKSIDQQINDFSKPIEKATTLVNQVKSDKTLELIATICSVLELDRNATKQKIISEIKSWSQEKADKFSEPEILEGINFLLEKGLIESDLVGFYNLNK